MPSADTMMLLDEANVPAVRLMARKLAEHDVVEVDRAARGQGPIAELAAKPTQSLGLDI